ncbi:type II 3-dehydroquinate dehydratase [Woodsholea maritima]|uniref:type II 3-dehydroquinate dehydratase n=1 Tax=Woodsholea maritima TaxID=240237 RepID=UPI0003770355|nr:type II 3-dehydroquinate dehydratase [Woodsholea maritima]
MHTIFILNGPNLNLLGTREPHIYGTMTLKDIQELCEKKATALNLQIDFRQTNHEGVLVDWIQEAKGAAKGLILNPAAYTHTSVALHDALKAVDLPAIEVHLSQPAAREAFRAHSYVASAVNGTISGFGAEGYVLGLDAITTLIAARP